MIILLKIVLGILIVFTAIGLLCAVRIGWRRPPPADPFAKPFGEMPGFSAAQLRALESKKYRQENSTGPATPAEADGDLARLSRFRPPSAPITRSKRRGF